QKFITYDEFRRRKQKQLMSDAIEFADPGGETSPAQLLRRLSDDEQGILLIGPAGSGKSRTCLEVAALAKFDWRLLFIENTAVLTEDDLRHAALDYRPARTLVIFDYIDTQELDFANLIDILIPDAADRDTKVAFLATCRPGDWLNYHKDE